MRWIVIGLAVALAAFAVSAFVSRDETCPGDNPFLADTSCKVTYWWDR